MKGKGGRFGRICSERFFLESWHQEEPFSAARGLSLSTVVAVALSFIAVVPDSRWNLGRATPFAFLDVARPRQAIGQAERLREPLTFKFKFTNKETPPGGVPERVGGRRPRIVKEALAPSQRTSQAKDRQYKIRVSI
eukprot:1024010-Prorocentrum_minimum.AAC.1